LKFVEEIETPASRVAGHSRIDKTHKLRYTEAAEWVPVPIGAVLSEQGKRFLPDSDLPTGGHQQPC